MASYINAKCISCGEVFTEKDDIVVCPDCGTPYHRSCYESEGACINTEAHQNNTAWEPEYEKISSESEETTLCPNCGTKNSSLNIFCDSCGSSLSADRGAFGEFNQSRPNNFGNSAIPPFATQVVVNDNTPLVDDVSFGEVRKFVGSNPIYFMMNFLNFAKAKKKISFNFMAILFPEFYFFYRKMHFTGLIMFFFRTIASLPTVVAMFAPSEKRLYEFFSTILGFTVTSTSLQNILLVSNIILYITMFVGGLLGNYFYYKKCINTIKKIKAKNLSEADTNTAIEEAGGVSKIAVCLAIGALFVVSYIVVYLMNNI